MPTNELIGGAGDLSHLAVIMDGNGRWAQRQGLPRTSGHKHGLEAAKQLISLLVEQTQVRYLTLFAFSNENWQRPHTEVQTLLSLFSEVILNHGAEFAENRVRLRFIGDKARFGLPIRQGMAQLEKLTNRPDSRLEVTLAVSYSGRWDIVQAAKQAANQAAKAMAEGGELTEDNFATYLSTAELPPPDLLIRTGGERRISNFMLWQLAYTELYFTPVLWPDFGRQDLIDAVEDFIKRERRYGLVGEKNDG